jgi:signal transduction histidine kinase
MQAVQRALEHLPSIPPKQLIAQLQEWQQLVMELATEPAQEAELVTLYEIIRVLNSSLDLTETLDLVMDSLIHLTGAERSCLMLLDEAGDLEIKAARHFDQKNVAAFDLELSHTVVQEVVKEGQPMLTTNAQLDPRFSARESVIGYQLRSIVCVPLHIREERVIGALYLDNRLREGVFSQADLPMLAAFANQAAVAIENARLFEAEREQRELTQALEEAAAVVNSTLDLDQVLDRILEQVERVVPGDTFNIMLLEDYGKGKDENADGNHVVRTVRSRGYEHRTTEDQIANLHIPVAKYPNLDKMMRTGKPIVVPSTADDPNWIPAEDREWRLSYVAAPILVADRVAGFLNVNGIQPGQFGPADAQRMAVFAHHAATALENARLYQESRAHANGLAATVIQLQELDRLKSEFIQNVSHELRTPLAVIQGFASLLNDGELGQLQPRQREPVVAIHRRVQELRDMVEDITLILGVEANPLDLEPVLWSELVRAAVRDFRKVAERAQLTLHADIPPNLPPISGAFKYLRRAVDNLLDNAAKFTPAGGSITVQLRQKGDWFVLQITDTGIGIPLDQQQRIFDRFYQVDGSVRRRYGGMGLGLALAKEVIEAHGGTIGVESEEGKRSTFTVTLPISQE